LTVEGAVEFSIVGGVIETWFYDSQTHLQLVLRLHDRHAAAHGGVGRKPRHRRQRE
jgi:hypothetical protein